MTLHRVWIHLISASRLHFTTHQAVIGFDVKDQHLSIKNKKRTVHGARFFSLDLKDNTTSPLLYGYLQRYAHQEAPKKISDKYE